MSELQYAFVNENGILINTAVFDSDNLDVLEIVKQQYNASNYYLIDNPTSFAFIFGEAYWSGTRFLNPAPYPSWIWNEEINSWQAPVPRPILDEENPKYYQWNEDILNWEEVQLSE